MKSFRDLPISRKLTLIIMSVSFLVLLLACGAFVIHERITYPRVLLRDMTTLAKVTSMVISYGVKLEDTEETARLLEALRTETRVLAAGVYNTNNVLWVKHPADSDASGFPTGAPVAGHRFAQNLEIGESIIYDDPAETGPNRFSKVGTLYLRASLADMYARQWRYVGIACAVLLAAVVIAFLLARRLQRPITEPVLSLTSVARRVSEQEDYTVRVEQTANDEIGVLIGTFNGMLREIEHRDVELRKARDEADKANRAKSDFLSFMSHELRTPLTSIIGFSEFLVSDMEKQAGQVSEEWLDDVRRIHSSGRHLLELINDILDLSKIEAGKMEIQLEQFEVKRVVEEAQAALKPLVAARGNVLRVDCPRDIGSIRADLIRLRQCLLNLLSNANKFTEKGEVTLSVERKPTAAGERILFRVRDTGIGMRATRSVPRARHRNRDDARRGEQIVPRLHPGRPLHGAQIRRHRAWPGPDPPLLPDDGRRHHRRERARQRVHLHPRPAGTRSRGARRGSNGAGALDRARRSREQTDHPGDRR